MSSWGQKAKQDVIITTGDSEEWRPLHFFAQEQVEYQTSEFDFIDKAGTLVKRKEKRGRRFDISIAFEGEDHHERAKTFQKSADDKRPWRIDHPYLEIATVHPLSLSYDFSDHNVSMITGEVVETIEEVAPRVFVDSELELTRRDADIRDASAATYSGSIPSQSAINDLSGAVDDAFNAIEDEVSDQADLESFIETYNDTTRAIRSGVNAPGVAMDRTIRLLSAPARFAIDLERKMSLIASRLESLADRFDASSNADSKATFETSAAGYVIASSLAPIIDKGKIRDRNEAIRRSQQVSGVYDTYLNKLDALSTSFNDTPASYQPDPSLQQQVSSLVQASASKLFQIAIGSNQERSIRLVSESDLITLTHYLYGIDPEEENIDRLMDINNIGQNEVMEIPRGRQIIYYV